MRQDHIRAKRDQFFGECGILIRVSSCETVLDLDIAALRPSAFAETCAKCRETCLHLRVAFGISNQNANARHSIELLPTRRDRPYRCAAE
jgi:hypothetical protein